MPIDDARPVGAGEVAVALTVDPAKRKPRCGPWDLREDGIHICRKCGRLDPLDFIEDDD